MSLTLVHSRRERPVRKHRALDRIAVLEQELRELRAKLAGADDFFMIQEQYVRDLETENRELKEQLAGKQDALTAIGKDRDALERIVRDLEGQLADAERRLDIRTWAEAAAAKTQELSIIQVVPLHDAPFATTSPGRVRPSWAKDEEAIA